MLSPLLVGPILREKCLCAWSNSNTTRAYPKALEKHFFLLEYLKKFGDIYKRLEKRLEPLLVIQDQWKRDTSYL